MSRTNRQLSHQRSHSRTLACTTVPTTVCISARPSKTINDLPWNLLQYTFEQALSVFSDLVVLTHVCSRWRNFALDTPTLWTHLTLSMRQLRGPPLQGLLNRSKTMKIDVDLTLPGAYVDSIEQIFDELRDQMDRVRTLILRCESPHQIVPSLRNMLNAAAQSLERFELRMVIPFSIPEYLFMGHAPHLRHLAVHFRHIFADRVGPVGCPALQAVTTLVSLDTRVTPPLNDRYSRLLPQLFPKLERLQLCTAVCPPNEELNIRIYTTEPLSRLEFTVPPAARNHSLAMHTLHVFDAQRVKNIVIHDAPSTTVTSLISQCDGRRITGLVLIFLLRPKLVNCAWRD